MFQALGKTESLHESVGGLTFLEAGAVSVRVHYWNERGTSEEVTGIPSVPWIWVAEREIGKGN